MRIDVVSNLDNYKMQYLDKNVRNIEIFCGSCGGRNKNYILFGYIYYVVPDMKILDTVKITFLIRWH